MRSGWSILVVRHLLYKMRRLSQVKVRGLILHAFSKASYYIILLPLPLNSLPPPIGVGVRPGLSTVG